MKKVIIVAFTLFCLLSVICHLSVVYADYVLPYPSFMPGNKLYEVSQLIDTMKKYWYFGNIAQIKYHLGLADKYIVEAKTLFEYKQYLLATEALNRSNEEFSVLPLYVWRAAKEGKNVQNISEIIQSAVLKHTDVLGTIGATIPSSFLWIPEKGNPTQLDLQLNILHAYSIRQQTVSELLKINEEKK